MVEGDDHVDEHEIGFGNIEVACAILPGNLFELANKVVGKEPDGPAGKGRQALDPVPYGNWT